MGISISLRNDQNNVNRHDHTVSTSNSNLPSSRVNLILSGAGFANNENGKRKKKPLNSANVSFSSHFLLAGRRFKSPINQTQSFLFGDQLDLGFIMAHKPVVVLYMILNVIIFLLFFFIHLFINIWNISYDSFHTKVLN